ncbi:MAG: ATP-binding protein [Nitrospira sp.]|nr:ATP-binding protein [Nitrospira sp.]
MVPAMLNAGNNLVSLGRSKGVRVTMITQRPAKLHKDALTQAQSLVAMRVLAPQDRKAIAEWIAEQADPDKGKEIIASLSSLRAGEAWVWAPLQGVLERVRFPLPKTFDSSKAPDETTGSGPVLAPINLDALKSRLSTIEAETKANDPRALKAEIVMLKKQMAEAVRQQIVPDPAAVEEAERRGYQRGRDTILRAVAGLSSELAGSLRQAEEAHAGAKRLLDAFSTFMATQADEIAKPLPIVARKPVQIAPNYSSSIPGDTSLAGPQRKLLTVLAQYPDGRTKRQLAVLAGYAHNGGAFNNPLSRLRSQGLAAGGSERLTITDAGLAALGQWEPLPAGRDLQEYWFKNLPGPASKLLRVLCDAFPDGMDKGTRARKSGYEPNGGAFNNPLARLRSLELVTGRGTAELRASEDLF